MKRSHQLFFISLFSICCISPATVRADQTAVSVEEIKALMIGSGNGTSFEGRVLNGAQGQPYRYQSCHSPKGVITARTEYDVDPGKYYFARGTWKIDPSGAVCLDWDEAYNRRGWIDSCYIMKKRDDLYTSTSVENLADQATGSFFPTYADFCTAITTGLEKHP